MLTQTPDTDANTANIDLFADSNRTISTLSVETTEVLNLSGTDTDVIDTDTITIENLLSGVDPVVGDLTTLNLSGDLAFDIWGVNAGKLSTVDATATTSGVEIDLEDVADSITVLGGSGDDEIVLEDEDSALVADGGDGDDYIEGYDNNDHLSGGAGNDTISAYAGIDSVFGGEGDDLILFDGAEVTAADSIDGGEGRDTVEIEDHTLGTQNDALFFQWNDVEVLKLYGGSNILTLGIIASNAGLDEIHLSTDGSTGDSITLIEGWSNPTAFYLSDGDDRIVDQVGVDLNVYADAEQVTADDTLTGGAGIDTLHLTADSSTATLTNVTGFETVMVVAGELGSEGIAIVTADTTVAGNETLTVDARALVDIVVDEVTIVEAGGPTSMAAPSWMASSWCGGVTATIASLAAQVTTRSTAARVTTTSMAAKATTRSPPVRVTTRSLAARVTT